MDNEAKLRGYLKRVTTDLHQARARLREREKPAMSSVVV
jgi:hypothetical protein